MGNTNYAEHYRNINFRTHPEKYIIGRGEQGVLIAEPYKSEILPYWKFATPKKAAESAAKIYSIFTTYKAQDNFVGMDMARKFLQMGFTRSRRYANHSSGKKYTPDGAVRPQDTTSEQSDKATSAKIFYDYYVRAKNDPIYITLKAAHQTAKPSVHAATLLPAAIGRVATRELAAHNIHTLAEVAKHTQKQLLSIHGVGPKAVKILGEALEKQQLNFRDDARSTNA